MAFNRRIMNKIEQKCADNQYLLDYMRDIVSYEMKGAKQYTKDYEKFLKERSREEEENMK